MKLPCGCCKGLPETTPPGLDNLSGQSYLRYRVGTHSSFLASMTARLSSADYPELAELTTRDRSDPSIAMLDVWATVADVLTFYEERIANEGYLRTATERLSILELAHLVGYTPKPGLASSVYLAYMLEKGYKTEIAAGQRAQSLPAPGELPQSFETSEPLKARSEWNAIKPRMTRPQNITWTEEGLSDDRIFLKGTANNIKTGDCLLFVFSGNKEERVVREIREVHIQADENRTEVLLQTDKDKKEMFIATGSKADEAAFTAAESPVTIADIFAQLSALPSIQPMGSKALKRNIEEAVTPGSDVIAQTITYLDPVPSLSLYKAFANVDYGRTRRLKGIFVMRQKASLFGYNALGKPPVAQFTMDPSSAINTNTTVQFTDISAGEPTDWLWDFGDGKDPSTLKNPTHRFTTAGLFTISLTVSNVLGASTSKWTTEVETPPIIIN